MKYLIILFLTTLICSAEVVQDEDEPRVNIPARLLVEKRILNEYLVENQDINIKYSIYNVGGNHAESIELNDNNLPDQYFLRVNSTSSIRISSLPPNGKVEKVLAYKPRMGTWGRVNFTSAEVLYRSKDLNTVLRTESSEPGQGFIISVEDYNKRFSLHLYEWGVFAIFTLFSVLFPYALYQNSKKKYDTTKNKSR